MTAYGMTHRDTGHMKSVFLVFRQLSNINIFYEREFVILRRLFLMSSVCFKPFMIYNNFLCPQVPI